jgi:hypothetical protein
LGGVIYFAALDLVPSTLNLRPALRQARAEAHIQLYIYIGMDIRGWMCGEGTQDTTMYKLSIFGMVWYRITISSGPLRTARTAARAAGRSGLSDQSTVYSGSTYKARGT